MRFLKRLAAASALPIVALLAQSPLASADGPRTILVHAGQSIQRAIDSAVPGDTILVLSGTYRESLQVTTDHLTLRGAGDRAPVLVPPAQPPANLCTQFNGAPSGICVLGQVTQDGSVVRPAVGDRVAGFDIRGFPANGLFGYGTDGLQVSDVSATSDGDYGIARFVSTRTRFVDNRVSGNQEAGLYVGDSPDADTLVAGNQTSGNGFGIFVRHSHHVTVRDNDSWANCLGVLVLDDGQPGGAGNVTVAGNRVHDNNRFCPADAEHGAPPLSGGGVVLVGAVQSTVADNSIRDNASGGTIASGGIVLISARPFAGADPAGDVIRDNTVRRSQPADIVWDGSGTGDRFVENDCSSSLPPGLCQR